MPTTVAAKMSRRLLLKIPFLVAACLLALAPAQAATSRIDLLRLVPDDVGFCMVIQDLRGRMEILRTSPFLHELEQSPLGVAIRQAPEIHKLVELDSTLQAHLQVDWTRLRDDILGDMVVLAYRPGPPGHPDQEQGLLLIQARDAGLLARLVDRLNEIQRQSGELKELQVRKHHEVEYHCRVERRQVQFYYLHGPVLAFTTQEEMLRQVIDLEQPPSAKRASFIAGQLQKLDADARLAALWINPRAFDPELAHKVAQAEGVEAAVLKTVLVYWRALDGVALSVSLEKSDLVLALALHAKIEELSPAARRLFAAETLPAELWNRFPDNALVAMAGRIDAPALVDMLGEFLTEDARKAAAEAANHRIGAILDKDVGKEILPSLGPDWGLCITAPEAGDKALFPQVTGALRIQGGQKDAGVDRAIVNGLNTAAMWLVFSYNSSHHDQLSLKTALQGKIEVHYLANEQHLPAGVQPAFGLKDGYLVLASSPEAIRRFAGRAPVKAPAEAPSEQPLLRISFRAVARFLQDRHDTLVEWIARKDHITAAEAGVRLDRLLANLRLFDRLELTHKVAPGQVTLLLRLHTVEPLRK